MSASSLQHDRKTLLFIIILCVVCGLLLASVAYSLKGPQKAAKEFDERKQMLIAAKILTHNGNFQLLEGETFIPAQFDKTTGLLVPTPTSASPVKATEEQIRLIAQTRIRALLTDNSGAIFSFQDKGLNLSEYLEAHKSTGYALLPLKIVYVLLPNTTEAIALQDGAVIKTLKDAYAFIIPVSGFGLWGPIFGFIALRPDGDTVLGTTWYEHGETPGLGANIAEGWWQKQFLGKRIFEETAEGKTDEKTATMGIIVVKGRVEDVYGTGPKAKSAVDGISGATLTGDGVTAAYRNSLAPYRPFLISLHKEAKS